MDKVHFSANLYKIQFNRKSFYLNQANILLSLIGRYSKQCYILPVSKNI